MLTGQAWSIKDLLFLLHLARSRIPPYNKPGYWPSPLLRV